MKKGRKDGDEGRKATKEGKKEGKKEGDEGRKK